MKKKRGKSTVVGFRVERNFGDLLDIADLNIAYLVEQGLIAHCKVSGSKSEMILNGAIQIIDQQLTELQEKKSDLIKLRGMVPTLTATTEQAIPVPAPIQHKVLPSDESILIIEKPVKRRTLPGTLCRSHKTQILYWIESDILQAYDKIFFQVNRDQDEGDDYLPIYSAEDIPLCELAGE